MFEMWELLLLCGILQFSIIHRSMPVALIGTTFVTTHDTIVNCTLTGNIFMIIFKYSFFNGHAVTT